MITLKSCPNCKSQNFRHYGQGVEVKPKLTHEIMPNVKVEAAILVRYSICQDCGLIFQNPRLSDANLDKFYSKGYYRHMPGSGEEERDTDELYRAKIDAEIIIKYVGKVNSHLDIGGSRGYLLDGIDADIKAIVEPNASYPKVKALVTYSKFDKIPQKSFDLVTAIHVLEHVSKPIDYLYGMKRLCTESGYLVVEVPTWKSPGGPLRLAHLYYFEPNILEKMCKQAGLEVVHTEFTPHLMLICKPVI